MDMNAALEQLAARVEKLELELKKEKAVTEIQNLLGRYVYMHIGGQHEGCMSLFSKREDMTVEIGPMGLFRGPKGLEQIYGVNHTVNEGDRVGFLAVHPLTTPVIEVADDLLTAKGLWLHHGVETQPDIDNPGEMGAVFMDGYYAIDFIYEDGAWKMWHFHMFPLFSCPWNTPFTEVEPLDRIMFERGERVEGFNRMQMGADEPTSYMREYSIDRATPFWPQPPEPYASFEGTRSMVGAPPKDVKL